MRREQCASHLQKTGLRLRKDENFDEVANADGRDQQQNNGLDRPHPEPLQAQQQQHIQARNDDGPKQRDVKQQIERHGAAEHFGQIARADRQFAQQPVGPARPGGYQSRQHCARSLPVTTPSRAEITCMKIAIRLASRPPTAARI